MRAIKKHNNKLKPWSVEISNMPYSNHWHNKNGKSNPTQEIVFNLREAYYRLKAEKEAEREFRAKEA